MNITMASCRPVLASKSSLKLIGWQHKPRAVMHIVNSEMDKEHLDRILKSHKAQPVGSGYIDVIVKRDNYKSLIRKLIEAGFYIESITWWEWIEDNKNSKYGLGGPESEYYNGWFAELAIKVDNVDLSKKHPQDSIKQLIEFIESKSIVYPNEKINFSQSEWLTPALWLKVPSHWENKNSA